MNLENLLFDPTYYGLSALVVLVALTTGVICLRRDRVLEADTDQRLAVGIGVVGFAFAAVMTVAVYFLALLREGVLGGILYLQLEFIAVFTACTALAYSVDRIALGRRRLATRIAFWISFASSVGIASVFLFDPSTYTITFSGGHEHVAQQGIFWLPAFVAFAAGAIGALGLRRKHLPWLSLFFLSIILGMLKESNLIPSLGDPFVDMMAAFIPFTAGSFFLLMSALRLRSPDVS